MQDYVNTLVNKDELIYLVDRMVDKCIDDFPNEEERAAQLLAHIGYMCYTQGMFAIQDERVMNPTDEQLIHEMFLALCAATQRWIVVQDYLVKVRSIDVHPMWMMMFVRGLYDTRSTSRVDRCMIAAYEKYIDANQEELEEIFGNHEVVSSAPDENLVKDPELMLKFFEAFKDLKTFHRNRDKYDNEQDKEKHDYLMSLFHAIQAAAPTASEEDTSNE